MEHFIWNTIDKISDKFPLLGGIINQCFMALLPAQDVPSLADKIMEYKQLFYKVNKITVHHNHLSQYMNFYVQDEEGLHDITIGVWLLLGIGSLETDGDKLTDYMSVLIMDKLQRTFPDMDIIPVVD